jgi:hypothetical protein
VVAVEEPNVNPPKKESLPPEKRVPPPPEKPKPVPQPERETKVSAPPQKPKVVEEEKRKAQPEEKPEPAIKPEKEPPLPKKEAFGKPLEERPLSPFTDLLSHGHQLIHENRQVRLLDQISRLTAEERQNINIRVLECFAYLKKIVLDKDRNSKQPWGQLYKSIENSKDPSATPLLMKIARDQEEYTRLYAVTLLGSIGDRRALNDLQQLANTDPNRKIRNGASRAIALIQKRG